MPARAEKQLESKNEVSEAEAVDLCSTIGEMRLQEAAYQAALAATARVLHPTLIDFLR